MMNSKANVSQVQVKKNLIILLQLVVYVIVCPVGSLIPCLRGITFCMYYGQALGFVKLDHDFSELYNHIFGYLNYHT